MFCGSSSNYVFMNLPVWRRCRFFYYGSIHLDTDARKHHLLSSQLRAIKASTLYLANTVYEQQSLAALGVPNEKIFVLGTGVDMQELQADATKVSEYRSKLKLNDNDVLIGYAGRIERTKNVQLLVESFLEIAEKHSNAHLLIAGSGEAHIKELQLTIAGFPLHVQQRIHWEIKFSNDVKPLIFNSLDILVLPSNNESFGLVFLEAWSCKKPVIGAAIGAVKDVIAEAKDGLLMEPNNRESLTQKIALLIDDKELRNQMGAAGYAKVKQHYTWDIITARLRNCYQQSLANENTKQTNQLVHV